MDRTALKNYAPKARREFIQAVTDRAAFYGLTAKKTEPVTEKGDVAIIGRRAFPRSIIRQRHALEERIGRLGFDQVMEAMAYTWFNRLVALRFMELHGYLDHGYRVLSHPEGKATPEIVEQAEHVTLSGLDNQRVIELKLDGTKENELYRLLLVAQCNALHEAMPFLFERIDDETELLLPENLLHSDSVIRKLVNEIDEEDWKEVEIIGWIYQFYISEKKDQVIGKVVKSEDIPAATQLFTPNWIVKYLVQNTLGRQWLATYPDSPLRKQMQYYIEPAKQTEEVKAQLKAITPESLNPEELTLLDPACGSGHVLVEAYDVFKAIYQERGYRSRDIPRIILQKNLYGLEIDDRAAQLAAFALLMKARADDRSIFADHIEPNVLAIQETKGLEKLLRPDATDVAAPGEPLVPDHDLFPDTKKQLFLKKQRQESPLVSIEPCIRELINLFEHGKTFGSLIRLPPTLAAQLPAARLGIEALMSKGQLWEHRVATMLMPLVKQAELMARAYDDVVTNPPYMGSKFYSPTLKVFVNREYKEAKADLYACFIQRNAAASKPNGFVGMITIPNWMFLSSFEEVRKSLFDHHSIDTFIHNGRGVFGSDFGTCAFTFRNSTLPEYRGSYRRLFDKQGSVASNEELEARFHTALLCTPRNNEMAGLPGSPIAFSAGPKTIGAFANNPTMQQCGHPCSGIQTGDNGRFLRFWWEVYQSSVEFAARAFSDLTNNGKRWVPHNKGGEFRRWYGNREYVLRWENDGDEIKRHPSARPQNLDYSFMEAVTWSHTSISVFSARYSPPGCTFNVEGPSFFSENALCSLGYLCSNVATHFIATINPTLHFLVGNVSTLPFRVPANKSKAEAIASQAIELARQDWDSVEASWDFHEPPALKHKATTLQQSQEAADAEFFTRFDRMKQLEEENNRLFIEAYGLQDELSPEVTDDQITLYRPDRQEDVKRLLSYGIGCTMGRYSLDKPGLVYAHSGNEGFDPSQYQIFPADADGIIPLTEVGWFSNDAAERVVEFIAKAWPAHHLEENLKFVAESIGTNNGEQSREIIRRYLSQSFFKDHLQTYKRRPIYWLFSSGKQRAFQCLVYLHRYHEGTLSRMRTEYVIPLQGKIAARIEQLASDIQKVTSTSHRKKLEKEQDTLKKQQVELQAFDEKLRHYADMRISLDLDDGVKVNYGKFGDLLAEVTAVCGTSEDDE